MMVGSSARFRPYAGRLGADRPQLQRLFIQSDLITPPGDSGKCLINATCSPGGSTLARVGTEVAYTWTRPYTQNEQ